MRGRLAIGLFDSSGSGLKIGRGLFISHMPGSRVDVGAHVTLYDYVRINLKQPNARVSIGDQTFLNRNVQIFAARQIVIGSQCAIGCDVVILDGGAHGVEAKPVAIGDRVWIGNGVKVMGGVCIGDGATIGAGSVVTRDVAPGQLAVGVPARELRPTQYSPQL